jgi:hypothetical protein
MNNNIFDLLQNWYLIQCNEDWKHEFGIKIDTLDNPGWLVIIDLKETDCENKLFTEIDRQINETNWIQCDVKDKKFFGYGGPLNLTDNIKAFIDWRNS